MLDEPPTPELRRSKTARVDGRRNAGLSEQTRAVLGESVASMAKTP